MRRTTSGGLAPPVQLQQTQQQSQQQQQRNECSLYASITQAEYTATLEKQLRCLCDPWSEEIFAFKETVFSEREFSSLTTKQVAEWVTANKITEDATPLHDLDGSALLKVTKEELMQREMQQVSVSQLWVAMEPFRKPTVRSELRTRCHFLPDNSALWFDALSLLIYCSMQDFTTHITSSS